MTYLGPVQRRTPDWVCKHCGIEAADHGQVCGQRISQQGKRPESQPVTVDERRAVATLCYMLRDVARRFTTSHKASDDEEFERLIGYLNLPPGVMLQAIQQEIDRAGGAKA